MNNLNLTIHLVAAMILLLPACGIAWEDKDISGEAGIIIRTTDNDGESAKFEEYRDLSKGLFGTAKLKYSNKDAYFFELETGDIAADDQRALIRSGKYGKYRIELIYDKVPHRFAINADTLYSGAGSGTNSLSDALQTGLQATGTDAVGDLDGNGTPNQTADRNIALANRLTTLFSGASTVDLELFRKTGRVNMDLMAYDPLNFRIEFSREERDGQRPIFGSFGFSNTVEIAEPIDYSTTELRLIAEYTAKPVFLSATYYLSLFDNHISTLTWDNPFRVTDSTSASAYAATYAAGPSKGLIDLYPDNSYHNISFTGSVRGLPLNSRLTATASWGIAEQDEKLVAYTTNTDMTAGKLASADGGAIPFDAFDRANLEKDRIENEVKTTLYNVTYSMKPLNFMHATARYRYYNYDNNTEHFETVQGHVRTDATWEPEHHANVPTSYKSSTAGIDVGFDILKATTLTLGYSFTNKHRDNREVSDENTSTYKASVDTAPFSWLNLRASYERSVRRGIYDFNVPFLATHHGEEEAEGPNPQLPMLRKYDQAVRDRDKVQVVATLYPVDALVITGSAIYSTDEYEDSDFGLLDEDYTSYSIDASYELTEQFNIFAFYNIETFENRQKSRQWNPCDPATDLTTTPGCTGAGEGADPFNVATGVDSPSNWVAENEDQTDTLSGGFDYMIIPRKLDIHLSYSYSKSDGKIRLTSPVGANNNVDLNLFVPVDFREVDDIKLYTLHAKIKYKVWKGITIAFGYLWEKFKIKDFSNSGFANVPTTATGAYNSALLTGTLPENYNVNVGYVKLAYAF